MDVRECTGSAGLCRPVPWNFGSNLARALSLIPMLFASIGSCADEFPKPLYARNCPDPGVILVDGIWYVTHTSGWDREGLFPILQSRDLTTWTVAGHIFPKSQRPVWASNGYEWWAPEIHKVNGRYVAYYCARQNANKQFAIGAATAANPQGPYTDIGKPLVSQKGMGLIDAGYFKDAASGKHYLLWKEDGNAFNPPKPTNLVLMELEADGVSTKGKPHSLLKNDLRWEGDLIEAPSLVYRDGYYYLFYSANAYYDDRYAVGVARSPALLGPYVKTPKPILKSDARFSGPGHQFVIQKPDGDWLMFYHARDKNTGKKSRLLMLDKLQWNKNKWPEPIIPGKGTAL